MYIRNVALYGQKLENLDHRLRYKAKYGRPKHLAYIYRCTYIYIDLITRGKTAKKKARRVYGEFLLKFLVRSLCYADYLHIYS
jgi:hypothetical protein